jgi:hypothetical protein
VDWSTDDDEVDRALARSLIEVLRGRERSNGRQLAAALRSERVGAELADLLRCAAEGGQRHGDLYGDLEGSR